MYCTQALRQHLRCTQALSRPVSSRGSVPQSSQHFRDFRGPPCLRTRIARSGQYPTGPPSFHKVCCLHCMHLMPHCTTLKAQKLCCVSCFSIYIAQCLTSQHTCRGHAGAAANDDVILAALKHVAALVAAHNQDAPSDCHPLLVACTYMHACMQMCHAIVHVHVSTCHIFVLSFNLWSSFYMSTAAHDGNLGDDVTHAEASSSR